MTSDRADAQELVDALRESLRFARAGGIPPDLEALLAGAVVDALLELDAWRRGEMDPKRKRFLQRARRAQQLRSMGATVEQIGARIGKSRSQVYRLLSHE